MLDAALGALPADIAICAAAVADWRAATQAMEKLKKVEGQTALNLALARNPDILATLAAPGARRPALVIGFAAETETIITHAQEKLSRKGADWIVANDVSPDTGIMGGDRTEVHLVSAAGVEDWPAMGKDEMAVKLLARAAEALHTVQLAAE
jgi:phosphopantothenoylcysteine decarboxylase/phosphopantothenate--cysteine ligase